MTGPGQPGGPAEMLDDHLAAEFATRDMDATMATITDNPYLNHVPVITTADVRRFPVTARAERYSGCTLQASLDRGGEVV
jgi:hypothetical protein